MEANKVIPSSIISPQLELRIPFYQRSYVWGEAEWKRFLEDLRYITVTKKPYFFGSVITKKMRPNQPYLESRVLVDGQQRMTTLLIFMKVLSLKTGRNCDYGFTELNSQPKVSSLKVGQNDEEIYKSVMAMKEPKEIESNCNSRIAQAYNYFIENVMPEQYDDYAILQNITFVNIDLNENEDEQQVFDTLNSLGVKLTTAELVKNQLFTETNKIEYDAKWRPVFEKDSDTIAYWNTEIEYDKNGRTMMDIFLDAYLHQLVYNPEYNIADKERLLRDGSLAGSYREIVKDVLGGDKSIIINGLYEQGKLFMDSFGKKYCDSPVPKYSGIERLNNVIFGLRCTTIIPYALYVLRNVDSKDEVNKIFGVIESYMMRRIIAGDDTRGYGKMYSSFIASQILDAESLKAKMYEQSGTLSIPSDEEVRYGAHNKKRLDRTARGILYLLESGVRPNNSALDLRSLNAYSLEHLMPKKWSQKWEHPETDELIDVRNSKIYTLGNLAIIPLGLNTSISNEIWSVKKEGRNGNPGLVECAQGVITLKDALNEEVWNEEKIDERANELADMAVELWKL